MRSSTTSPGLSQRSISSPQQPPIVPVPKNSPACSVSLRDTYAIMSSNVCSMFAVVLSAQASPLTYTPGLTIADVRQLIFRHDPRSDGVAGIEALALGWSHKAFHLARLAIARGKIVEQD